MSCDWVCSVRVSGLYGTVELKQEVNGGRAEIRKQLLDTSIEIYKSLKEIQDGKSITTKVS